MKIQTIAIPEVAHKGPYDTDAGIYRRAAHNLDLGYPIGGGNVTRAVSQLLNAAAKALDARPPDFYTAYDDACAEIFHEAIEARRAYPPFNSSHEGYAVLLEEVDELWADVKTNNVEHAIEEAIQVGAMAIRFIADMRAKTLATSDAKASEA